MSDELEALVKALQRKVNAQAGHIQDLEDRVTELETVVNPDPGSVDYEQLTKAQKIQKLRLGLIQSAARSNGKYAMKYREVMTFFDGHPSAGHCYDLMDRAGELEGFAYDKANGSGEKRIRVDIESVNDDALIHAANKATEGTPA